jgi:hypothetical protein
MCAPLFRTLTLACAVLLLAAAQTASARPKKSSAQPASTAGAMCLDTPIIMQGMECAQPVVRAQEQPPQQPETTERPKRPRVTARGSGGSYVPSVQPTPSVNLPPAPQGVYIPPPVANPSAQINQLNQSFPLNGGLGNNSSNRDTYIRQNMTR